MCRSPSQRRPVGSKRHNPGDELWMNRPAWGYTPPTTHGLCALCTHLLTQRPIVVWTTVDTVWTAGRRAETAVRPATVHSATTSTVTGNSTSACSLAGTTCVPSDLMGSASTSLRRSIWTFVCASIGRGDVGRGDRAEQPALAARPGGDRDHLGHERGGQRLGGRAVLRVAQVAGPTHAGRLVGGTGRWPSWRGPWARGSCGRTRRPRRGCRRACRARGRRSGG